MSFGGGTWIADRGGITTSELADLIRLRRRPFGKSPRYQRYQFHAASTTTRTPTTAIIVAPHGGNLATTLGLDGLDGDIGGGELSTVGGAVGGGTNGGGDEQEQERSMGYCTCVSNARGGR